MKSRESQEQEQRVRLVPQGLELRRLEQLRQVQSQHQCWILDEKEVQQGRLTTAGRVVSFFFVML